MPIEKRDAPQVDEFICEEETYAGDKTFEEVEAEEISNCEKYLYTSEKLLMILHGSGEPRLNRLAVTDRRLVFYPSGQFQNGKSFEYSQIDSFRIRKSIGWKSHLSFSAMGRKMEFKNMSDDWAKEVEKTIKLIQKEAS